jgi:hypothetical protein
VSSDDEAVHPPRGTERGDKKKKEKEKKTNNWSFAADKRAKQRSIKFTDESLSVESMSAYDDRCSSKSSLVFWRASYALLSRPSAPLSRTSAPLSRPSAPLSSPLCFLEVSQKLLQTI